MFTSTNHTQFADTKRLRIAIKRAGTKCIRWLDQYPLKDFEDSLHRIVADAQVANLDPVAASNEFRNKLVQFFQRIDGPSEWEVVIGVYGISPSEDSFTLGPCRFFVMRKPNSTLGDGDVPVDMNLHQGHSHFGTLSASIGTYSETGSLPLESKVGRNSCHS